MSEKMKSCPASENLERVQSQKGYGYKDRTTGTNLLSLSA